MHIECNSFLKKSFRGDDHINLLLQFIFRQEKNFKFCYLSLKIADKI